MNDNSGKNMLKFPYDSAKERLGRYSFNDRLFEGKHFEAFAIKIDSTDFSQNYARLKYVTSNFAGLISKVAADLLFGEAPHIYTPESKDTQRFIDALIFSNELHVQNYESALQNSRRGDAVYKLRIEDGQLIVEDINPAIYFPHIDKDNVRNKRKIKHELAWQFHYQGKDYVRKEIHEAGLITNEIYLIEDGQLAARILPENVGLAGLPEFEETKIERSLIIHVPNWKDGSRFFGYDDYSDLTSLFYAINNRMTKNENILDKHSDPILALPEGVLDEDGQVKREAFNMFEMPSDPTGKAAAKPEYITWNANLEAAFKQIDKLMEHLFATSETSPAAFGLDSAGQAESGRALKFKLMRTLAKVNRKRLYYDQALKNVVYTAQLLAKAHNLDVMGVRMRGEAILPEIDWNDGLPQDSFEAAQEEQLRIEAGNTSAVDSIMRLDNVDRETALRKYEEIKAESAVTVPSAAPNLFGGDNDGDS